MFDLGLVHTHHTCSFDVTIHLSSLFVWGPLDPGLMAFSTHCISCMRGMGIISLGSLSLVSFHFFHPITLAYVHPVSEDHPEAITSHCVWRLTHGQYSSLVGDYFLEHDGRGVEMMIYTRAYPSYQWWIFRGDVIYVRTYPLIDVFFQDDALHWGIINSLLHLDYDGLRVVSWPYTRA